MSRFIRLFIHYIDGGMMTGTEGMLDFAVGKVEVLFRALEGRLNPPRKPNDAMGPALLASILFATRYLTGVFWSSS